MRRLLPTLLFSAAAIPLAFAQGQQAQQPGQQAQMQQQAQQDSCGQLITFLQRNPTIDSPVTLNQARDYQQQGNQQACQQALTRAQAAQGQGQGQQQTAGQGQQGQPPQSEIVVQRTAPHLRFQQAAPQITVQQPQPQVTVRQPQPQILVRQPAPTISVQQAQPEIIVRMPEPEVAVSMPEPRVSVQQPQPQVRVQEAQQEPQVQVQRAQPRVTVQRSDRTQPVIQRSGQPQVQFEQVGEPQLTYQRAQGQPQIRFERTQGMGRQAQRGSCGQLIAFLQNNPTMDSPVTLNQARDYQQQGNEQACRQALTRAQSASAQGQQGQAMNQRTTGMGAAGAGSRSVAVSRLVDQTLYNIEGVELGEVQQVVVGPDNTQYMIVDDGMREIALPLRNAVLNQDGLFVRGISPEDIANLPEWNEQQAQNFRQLQGNDTARIWAGG